jgi:hypothetical protein
MRSVFVLFCIGYVLLCLVMGSVLTAIQRMGTRAASPSFDVESSMASGAFLKQLTAIPNDIDAANERLMIRSAWIEKRRTLAFEVILIPFIWHYPVYENTGDYFFIIGFSKEQKPFHEHEMSFFVADDSRESLSVTGGSVAYSVLDDPSEFPRRIRFTNSWQMENAKDIHIR